MIIYFSGTGNSEYAAERIGRIINEEAVDLFEKIRRRDFSEIISAFFQFILTFSKHLIIMTHSIIYFMQILSCRLLLRKKHSKTGIVLDLIFLILKLFLFIHAGIQQIFCAEFIPFRMPVDLINCASPLFNFCLLLTFCFQNVLFLCLILFCLLQLNADCILSQT